MWGGENIPVRSKGRGWIHSDNVLKLLYTRSQASCGPSREARPPSRAMWNRAVPGREREQRRRSACCLRHSLVVQSPNSSPSPYPDLREVQLPRTHDPEMTLNLCPCWCCLATPALTPTGLLSSQSHTLPQVCNADLLDIRDLRSPDSTGRLLIFLSGVVNLSTAKVLITCCAFFPKPI